MTEKRTQLTRTSLYFEDFEVGQTVTSPGRTITEGDVLTFAGLSGDFNPIHTDAEYAAGQPYGQRVAHGLLGTSIGVGLIVRMGFLEESILGFREIDGWKFSAPIYLGDTIHVEGVISETRAVHRLGGGLVTMRVEIQNQAGKVVQQGSWSMLVKSSVSEKG
jgi:3-hydroxybutyryl-CoA dehydratase